MNYRKALLGHAFIKQNNQDFVMVAPQGPNETSCNPKYKKFTLIRQVKNKNRKAKPAIIEFNYKDEDIPYVKKKNEKLVIINYKASSLYIVRKMDHSEQFHKFAEISETKKFRRQHKMIQQTRKVKNNKFHDSDLKIENYIKSNKNADQACFKCEHQHENTAQHKKLQLQLKFAKDFCLYLRKNHQCEENYNKKQIIYLNKLARQK